MRGVKIEYTLGRTASNFIRSKSFMRVLEGPIACGKTFACCVELLRNCIEMPVDITGKRKSRWAVVYTEKQPIYQTMADLFKGLGSYIHKEDKFELRFNNVEAEILLLDPSDTRILSTEFTAAYLSNLREISVEVYHSLCARVGRYPAWTKVKNYQYGMIADTYPIPWSSPWLVLGNFEIFTYPSAFAPDAENIENLPLGYYTRVYEGKSREWANEYLHGCRRP